MSSAGFEPAIPATKRPQNYAFHRIILLYNLERIITWKFPSASFVAWNEGEGGVSHWWCLHFMDC
jgi:hypothetical protein